MLLTFHAESAGNAQDSTPGPAEVAPHGLTFTLDPARTRPGTFEAEFGLSVSEGEFTAPLILKYTPNAPNPTLGNTEFALIGAMTSFRNDAGGRILVRGRDATLLVRHVLHGRGRIAAAISPRMTISDGTGPSYGMGMLVSFAKKRDSVTANLILGRVSGADSGGGWAWDVLADYFRVIGVSAGLSRLGVFGGLAYQVLSDGSSSLSFGEGMSYRMKPSLEINIAIRQEVVNRDASHVFLLGLTRNFGPACRGSALMSASRPVPP